MLKNLNRVHLLLDNLDIWVYPDEKKITVTKQDKIPYGSMVVIPEDAKLFEGTYKEFEDFLEHANRLGEV
jgi:hypothetical protein